MYDLGLCEYVQYTEVVWYMYVIYIYSQIVIIICPGDQNYDTEDMTLHYPAYDKAPYQINGQ